MEQSELLRYNLAIKPPVPPAGSTQILCDVERAMEYAENLDASFALYEIGDAVMPVEKNSDVLLRLAMVGIAPLRESSEALGSLKEGLDRAECSRGIVLSNVIVNLAEPALCFPSPSYLAHEEIL